MRLADLAFLVVSQENSCRCCYGAARAHMRILGDPERGIGQIAREMQLAELDGRFRLRAMPAMLVKGKAEPLTTYFVESVELPVQVG